MPAHQTTILIVDDDQLHLTLYTWILQGHGYKCKSALVRSTSVDWPADDNIDLVLLDYLLSSSLTAMDVLLLLKSKFPSVPIVLLSEMQWMPDDMRGHAVAFVNKGDPKLLVDTIDGIIQSKSA
jgi:DNA-binding NtrC family response regulator